ncbi:DUF2303 family protein [Marinobacter nauticus]|uniref:Uncharacterized protein YfdQ (DUF2303 family) n=1 Tax=Marinobacter nauticus TaxID=2743 RepID=A0A368V3G0_MARNT|nr:DUF2303 family protein [Marinobacter nauticus]RBP74071.1 uncharacterized protein YfdQ (DUF2303 family) [Marinobacter nauticus]RCW34820.1 uncharacterized protein YfdQ (DUF2303 family) [Marinobacter nauticus]
MESVMQDNSALHEYTKIVQVEAIQTFLQQQTEGSTIALPEGVRVADLEQYLENRRRYRGTMSTNLISEFVEYVKGTVDGYNEFPVENFPCFINPQAMRAIAFFNLGDVDNPGHGDHQAKLSLLKTEAFQELLKINGDRFDQRQMAEWLEDWVDHIEAITEDGTILPLNTAVASIRRITIGTNAEATSEEQTFSSRRSAMAEVEAKHKDQLPAFLKFTCEPYQGLQERTFTVRLSLITGEKPQISARIVRLETAQEEMAKELEEKLRSGFEDSEVRTFVGEFDHR